MLYLLCIINWHYKDFSKYWILANLGSKYWEKMGTIISKSFFDARFFGQFLSDLKKLGTIMIGKARSWKWVQNVFILNYILKIDFCGLTSNQGPNKNPNDSGVQKCLKNFGKTLEVIDQLSYRKLYFKINWPGSPPLNSNWTHLQTVHAVRK